MAGLGQAQMARPAMRGGMVDRMGRGHVCGVGRSHGACAPDANQPETVTRMNFKAFNMN